MGWDPAEYGTAFADVYDEWYANEAETDAALAAIGHLKGRRGSGRLLELGVGTGRLAIPLAEAGWQVVGLDASPDMLARLNAKQPSDPAVVGVLGDAAVRADYPNGPFDVVLAAYNFVFNLPTRQAQAACLVAAADVAAPDAALVVEAFVPDGSPPAGSVSSPGPVDGVTIVSEVDVATGVVHGEHRHSGGRRRPWHVCPATPAELDQLAGAAGWRLETRWETWDGVPFEPRDSGTHVSVYRLVA